MRRFMLLILAAAAAGLLTGCATRDWVKDLVGKREADIDQRVAERVGAVDTRVGRVEGRVGDEVGRLDARLGEQGQRVGRLETTVGEVGAEARAARARAEEAQGRADQVDARLTRLWSGRHKRQVVETVHVQFAFDRADLSDAAQTALLTIVRELDQNPNLSVDLQGFTDPSGAREYNVALSQRRVEAVRRFLIERGADLARIHSIGLGPLPAGQEERAKQRRVTVRLLVAAE